MKKVKNTVKAIIFDMDGTIIQTEHVWEKATIATLKKRGITSFTQKQKRALKSLSGAGVREACKTLQNVFSLNDKLEVLCNETVNNAKKIFGKGVEFIHGFEQFHKMLKAHNIPSAIATNATLEILKTFSNTMNFPQFFGSNLYCISHVEDKEKPDPALFLHTAKKLGVRPEDCVVFEDSIYGFQAAKAAGMQCIAIENDKNHSHRQQADHAISDYRHALDALRTIVASKKA